MRPYKNRSGVSGVTAFKITSDSILVQFNGNSVYEYFLQWRKREGWKNERPGA